MPAILTPFEKNERKGIKVQKTQSFRMESFYVYYLRGKIPNLQYENFERKTFTKRAIKYEHS